MKKIPKTYSIQTYGCQMNYSDSERFSAYLQGIGMEEAKHWQVADVIVLNTCSVKQKAEDRITGIVNNIRKLTDDTNPTIVLTGCMARRIWDENKAVLTRNSSQKDNESRVLELKDHIKGLDLVVETKDFPSIGEKLGFKRNFDEKAEHYLSYKPNYKSKFQAYVPISTGCNHFCTFCIVPFARGKEVCRPATEVIREVYDLIRSGYKDITLLGQTVNRWINPDNINDFVYNEAMTRIEGLNTTLMSDADLKVWSDFFKMQSNSKNFTPESFTENLKMPRDFLQLLQVLDQIQGQWWTTWVSSHPNYMTPELIEFIANSVKNSWYNSEEDFDPTKNYGHQRPYLHFALQSGSDNMLKKMNRRHSAEEFKKIVEKMDTDIPELSLSTDIIVGFVKESREDFEETLKIEEELKFDMIYISEYSPRKGTAAERLPDTVPNEVKAERKNELNELLKKVAKQRNNRFLGSVQIILVDSLDKKSGKLLGRNPQNKPILIENSSDESLIGMFTHVKVTQCSEWKLKGVML